MAISLVDNTAGAGEPLNTGFDKVNQAITRVNQFDALSTGDISALNTIASITPSDNTFIVGTGTEFQGRTASQALTDLGLTATASELNILDGATLSTTELNYVDGVTSAIQAQLDNKQPLDSELTTLSGMSSSQATGLVGTSGTANFNAIDIGGTDFITSSRNATVNSLSIDATGYGFDSSGNVSGLSYKVGSFKIADRSGTDTVLYAEDDLRVYTGNQVTDFVQIDQAGTITPNGSFASSSTLGNSGARWGNLFAVSANVTEGVRFGSAAAVERVQADGTDLSLYATDDVRVYVNNQTIDFYQFGNTGEITPNGGFSGSATLGNSGARWGNLYSVDGNLSGNLSVTGTGTFSGDLTAEANLLSGDYDNSTWAGAGYQGTNAGDWVMESLRVRGKLEVYEFVAKQISSVGGKEILSIANGRIESTSGSDQIVVQDVRGQNATSFKAGDLWIVQVSDINNDKESGGTGSIVRSVTGRVTSVTGDTLTVTFDGTDTIADLEENDLIVAYGSDTDADRQSIMYRNVDRSDDNLIMRVQTNVDAFADLTASANTRVAYGDLNGYGDIATETFGFFAGDVSSDYLTIDATNGVRFIDGSDSNKVLGKFSGQVFSFGDVTEAEDFIKFDNSGGTVSATANLSALEIDATEVYISSANQRIAVGSDGSAVTVANTTAGTVMEDTGFKSYLDASNYIRRDGSSLDIKASVFSLSSSNINVGTAGGGFINLGSTPPTDPTDGDGFLVNGSGDFLVGNTAGNYINRSGSDLNIVTNSFDLTAGSLSIDSTGTTAPSASTDASATGPALDLDTVNPDESNAITPAEKGFIKFQFDYDFSFSVNFSLDLEIEVEGFNGSTWQSLGVFDYDFSKTQYDHLVESTGTSTLSLQRDINSSTRQFWNLTSNSDGNNFTGTATFYGDINSFDNISQYRLKFILTKDGTAPSTADITNINLTTYDTQVEVNSEGIFLRKADAITNENGTEVFTSANIV